MMTIYDKELNLDYIRRKCESYTDHWTMVQVVKQEAMMSCKCSLDDKTRNTCMILVRQLFEDWGKTRILSVGGLCY